MSAINFPPSLELEKRLESSDILKRAAKAESISFSRTPVQTKILRLFYLDLIITYFPPSLESLETQKTPNIYLDKTFDI